MQVSGAYEFVPKKWSLAAGAVMDHFGIGFETGRYVVAEGLDLDIRPGDVVLFVGESGSGKSSLMRAVASQLGGVIDADRLDLGDRVLVQSIGGAPADAIGLLTSVGLGEARLMLRSPAELSDGQRYRFRLAQAFSVGPCDGWLRADEFTGALDRTLAKVIAFNFGRLCRRLGRGCLLATCHEDVIADLRPSVLVRCSISAAPEVIYAREEKGGAEAPGASRVGGAVGDVGGIRRDGGLEAASAGATGSGWQPGVGLHSGGDRCAGLSGGGGDGAGLPGRDVRGRFGARGECDGGALCGGDEGE